MTRALKKKLKAVLPQSLWKRLGDASYRLKALRFRQRTVRHLYGGASLSVFLADPIAEEWYDHDYNEPAEIALLAQSRLKPGASVFDLGAHHCVVAMMLANAVRPAGKIIAVEPSAHNAGVGATNCRANGYQDVHILNAAIAERPGKVAFTPDGRMGSARDRGSNFQVNSHSIDDLAERFGVPDVVYIDIEGYECHALAGARMMLQQKTDWFVEVHVGHGLESFGGSAERVLRFFPRDAYKLYVAAAGESGFVPLESADFRLRDRFYLVALHR
ncbi:MAG TPA: FkbM family methyltransferase [Terriglobia bacterium]|nr:FkbM family methyltransferase [Terriglobia bacterium]